MSLQSEISILKHESAKAKAAVRAYDAQIKNLENQLQAVKNKPETKKKNDGKKSKTGK